MESILERYAAVAGEEAIEQLLELAQPLKGKRVINVNSTKAGGGVAEILTAMVPLMQALGLDARWEVIEGGQDFFQCTKSFHNALQGTRGILPKTLLTAYEETNQANAEKFKDILNDADFVVIHDPQPLAMITHLPNRKGKWIWRCHIDASKPFRPVWNYLSTFMKLFDASIFSLPEFAHPLPSPMFIIKPSIDPLSQKNIELDPYEISKIYDLFKIDPERPYLLQVSRYDRFKDPLGVIECYRQVKKFNKKVQLVLAGGGAADDPEGDIVLQETQLAAADDPDIHVLLLPNDSHILINALQRGAEIVLQKSVKEGFGLTVTEALWKGKPVIGGNTGGIKVQVHNGQTGFLVNTPEGAASRIRFLLQHPKERKEMSQKAKVFVREKFLITRNAREYLTLFHSVLFNEPERIYFPKTT